MMIIIMCHALFRGSEQGPSEEHIGKCLIIPPATRYNLVDKSWSFEVRGIQV